MKLWMALGGGIAALFLLAGAYAFGRSDGSAIEIAKQAAVEKAVAAERAKREENLDQAGAAAARQETRRVENVREINHEFHTVTERPVYRDICVDADGVRLLDRAARVAAGANSLLLPPAAGPAAQGAP